MESDLRETQPRCGWPFSLPQSSTEVYCSLAACHDGPECSLLNDRGETVAATARFGVRTPD